MRMPLEKIEGGLAVDIFLKIEDYHGQRVAQQHPHNRPQEETDNRIPP